MRGVIGLAAGSKANNPMTAKNTYRAYVGVGADSSGLLNPILNASLVGINTNITTPNVGTAFVQAGLYGTAKMSENRCWRSPKIDPLEVRRKSWTTWR